MLSWSNCACWHGLAKYVDKTRTCDKIVDATVVDAEVAGLPSIQAEINFGGGTHMATQAEINIANLVNIYDGRADPARFTLEEHGFKLVQVPGIGLDGKGDRLDLYDADIAVSELFPRAEKLILSQCPGSVRAIAFDHIIRNPERLAAEIAEAEAKANDLAQAEGKIDALAKLLPSSPTRVERKKSFELNAHSEMSDELLEPVPSMKKKPMPKTPFLQGALAKAHGDYTVRSGPTRTEQLLTPWVDRPLIDKALANRFQIINVWYPFHVVKSDPLAVCTWPSISPQDLRTNRLIFKHRIGETYKARYSAKQRWVYFSDVTPDEAILLKTYDSVADGKTARFSLHSAFELPEQVKRRKASMPPLPVRESLEVRVLVFYGDGLEDLAKDFVPPHMCKNNAAACEIVGDSLQRTISIDNCGEW